MPPDQITALATTAESETLEFKNTTGTRLGGSKQNRRRRNGSGALREAARVGQDRGTLLRAPRLGARECSKNGSSASTRLIGSSRSWDTTSKAEYRARGDWRFIEVKGGVSGAATITVTRTRSCIR